MSRLTMPHKYEVISLLIVTLMILGLSIAFVTGIAYAHVTNCDQFGTPPGGGCLEPLEEGPMGLTNNDPEHVLCYVIGVRPGDGSSAGEPYIEIVPCPLPPLDGDTPFDGPTTLPTTIERAPQPGPNPASAPALPSTGTDYTAMALIALTALGAGMGATALAVAHVSKDEAAIEADDPSRNG